MISRRALLKGTALGAIIPAGDPGRNRAPLRRGGLPPARPEQRYDLPGPAAIPTGSRDVVTARLIVVKGAGPPNGGVFLYDASGNLVDSMATATGPGPSGGTAQRGIFNYSPATGARAGLDNGTVVLHSSGMTAQDGEVGAVFGTDAIVLQSGQATGHNQTNMVLGATTGVTATDGRDGQTYGVERAIVPIASGNIPVAGNVYTLVTVNLVGAAQVTYKFRVVFNYENTVAAGTANFQLGGTATLGARQTLFTRNNDVTSGGVSPGSPATFTTLFSGGTASTGRQFMEIEGIVDITSSGTLTLTVTRNIAGDNVLVGNCWFEIFPV